MTNVIRLFQRENKIAQLFTFPSTSFLPEDKLLLLQQTSVRK